MKPINETLKQGYEYLIKLTKEDQGNDFKISLSVAFGAFMGILPIWGFQLVLSVALAYALKLNKPLVALFSNVSIPPMIPIILYVSVQLGSLTLQGKFLTLLPQEITWKCCRDSFTFYLWGSFLLALMIGMTFGLFSYIFLKILKRYGRNNA